MGEWKEYILKDFAEINPTERLPKGSIAKKIAMETLQPFTKKISSYSVEEYKGGMKFRNGDTIMARITPSLENGKTSYVDILDINEIGFGSTEYIVFRERKGISDKNFIYYLTTSPIVRATAIKSMTGSSGRQRVQTDVVKEHKIIAPKLDEQKSIANILSRLDDKIDLLHRQNKILEQMAETLFRKQFIEGAKDNWEKGNILDYASHLKVSVHPKKSPKINYYHYSIPSFDKGKNPIREFGIDIQSNKYGVPTNCILFSKLNPHKDKRVWLLQNEVREHSICSTEFQIVKPNKDIFLYFIYGWLSYYQNYKDIASGVGGTSSSHQRIDPNTIFEYHCPVVDEVYIEEYANQVEPIFNKQVNNQDQIRTLENLRDTLLPKLMSGEIKISLDD